MSGSTRPIDRSGCALWYISHCVTYNYEELEYVGDAILNLIFPLYSMERVGNASEQQLTCLKTSYMAKDKQADIAYMLELNKHIRVAVILQFCHAINFNSDNEEEVGGSLTNAVTIVVPQLDLCKSCFICRAQVEPSNPTIGAMLKMF